MPRAALEVEMALLDDVQRHLVIGVSSPSRDQLVSYLKDWVRKLPEHERTPLLHIIMPCGHEITYNDFSDLPTESVPCTCRNAAHWFIRYSAPPPPPRSTDPSILVKDGGDLLERIARRITPGFMRAS